MSGKVFIEENGRNDPSASLELVSPESDTIASAGGGGGGDKEEAAASKGKEENELEEGVSSKSHHFKPGPYVRFIHAYPRACLLALGGLMVGLAVYAFGIFGDLSKGGFHPPLASSTLTENYFSNFANLTSPSDLTVLVSHPTWTVDNQLYIDAAALLKTQLRAKFPVSDFVDPFSFSFLSALVSEDKHSAIISAKFPDYINNWVTPPYAPSDFEKATAGNPLTILWGGNLLAQIENSQAVNDGLAKIESGSVPVLLVLLVFAFNGVVAIIAPLLLIVWTIIFSFVGLRMVAIGFHVSTYSTQVCAIFGAGLGMDFSLFMHLRFLEEMKRNLAVGMDDDTAVLRAVSKSLETSGRVVAFSGALLGATLSGALQFHLYYARSMCVCVCLCVCVCVSLRLMSSFL